MKKLLYLFILSFLFSSSALAEDYYREVSSGVATLRHHQGHTFTRIDLEGQPPLILDSRCSSYPCTLQVKEGDTPFALMGTMANASQLILLAGGKLRPGMLVIKDPRGGIIWVIPPK